MQIFPKVYLRRKVYVQAPRDHVQVCWCLHPDELRLQTFKAEAVVDQDESADADAADANANDDGLDAVVNVLTVIRSVINSNK